MSGLSTALTAQHGHCDALLAAAQASLQSGYWEEFSRRLPALRQALLDHFWFEEEELFPAFERVTGLFALTAALRKQHMEIRAILDTLGAASPRHDPEGCRAEFGTLAAALRRHVSEEEHVLYPAIERSLGSEVVEPAAGQPTPAPAGARAVPAAELDVRGLPPPEPFLRIMEALSSNPEAPLRVLIHKEPLPLYDVLEGHGRSWRTRALVDGSFEILIERGKG